MGSSKKHNSEKERSRKSKEESSSRSSTSKKQKHSKEKPDSSSSKRKRSPSPPSQPEKSRKSRRIDPLERETENGEANPVEVVQQGDISLSIEETNKLREKLGLPPLQLDDKPKEKTVENADGSKTTENVYTKEGVEFVHKPADNWADDRKKDKMREKLQTSKDKRKHVEKLSSLKPLSAKDDDDSALSWVERSRKLEERKKMAAQRAKILAEMDEDFGIESIISDHVKDRKAKAYTSKDLKNLTVQHAIENMNDESETILVLEDKDVLDTETEDVLVNPTLKQHEKWTKNAELRKKKVGYDPFQDDFDAFGKFQEKSMLGKYDEEIDGEKQPTFKIGQKGQIDVDREMFMADKLKLKLKEGFQTLETEAARLANEFFTREEMEKFKKTKKKVKTIRKRGDDGLKPQDLINSTSFGSQDLGSRNREVKQETNEDALESNGLVLHPKPEKSSGVDLRALKAELNDESDQEDNFDLDDLTNVVIEDDAETELQSALTRNRLIKQLESEIRTEKAADVVFKTIKEEEPEMEDNAEQEGIILNTVSEYCRGLGEMLKNDEAEYANEVKRTRSDSFSISSDDGEGTSQGKWVKAPFGADVDHESSKSEDEDDGKRPAILDEELNIGGGVGAALKMAQRKGYLESGNTDHGPSRLAHLEAKKFTVMDKQFYDIDDKYAKKLERMGASGGPVMDFKEKSNYKPNVNLRHFDKYGQSLDAKEAFRQLCWKFHGKDAGKKKTEMRLKRMKEEQTVTTTSAVDTPLGTLSKQMEKQKTLSTPFIILSGAGSKDGIAHIKKE